MSDDVTMTCRCQVSREVLRIDYEIVNHTRRGVYAFVLPTDAEMEAYDRQTYVSLSANRRILYLVVDHPPIPDNHPHDKRTARPLAAFVKPSASYQNRFLAYLPIREWHAYAMPHTADYGSSIEVAFAMVSLSYAFQDQALANHKSVVPGYFEVESAMRKRLQFSLKLPSPVAVQPRLEQFSRMSF